MSWEEVDATRRVEGWGVLQEDGGRHGRQQVRMQGGGAVNNGLLCCEEEYETCVSGWDKGWQHDMPVTMSRNTDEDGGGVDDDDDDDDDDDGDA